MRGYWPEQTEDPTGVTAYLNDVRKYVVSSMINDPQWQNTTVLSGDPIQQVRADVRCQVVSDILRSLERATSVGSFVNETSA